MIKFLFTLYLVGFSIIGNAQNVPETNGSFEANSQSSKSKVKSKVKSKIEDDPAFAPQPNKQQPLDLSKDPQFFDNSIFSQTSFQSTVPNHWLFSTNTRNLLGLKSTILQPIGSFFLPGLGQYINGNSQAGLVYTGTALLGFALVIDAQNSNEDLSNPNNFEELSDKARQYTFGAQLYQQAGSMSLYHNFLTNVQSHQRVGKYQFLKRPDNPKDVYLAPFKFSFLTRHTTYIPLLIVAGLVSVDDPDYETHSLSGNDFMFASGISYNAGTGEEALFRGWLMPLFREGFGSDFWSNTSTALIFAAAHIGKDNPYPLPQLSLGWYLGWLTQKNHWSIQESVFIHTWWDVIAISYILTQREKTAMIPLINATF